MKLMNHQKIEITEKLERIAEGWASSEVSGGERQLLTFVGRMSSWSYGITSAFTFCFYLESPVQIGCGHQLCTKTIKSEEYEQDGVWILKPELLDLANRSIFISLMADLISESLEYEDDESCVRATVDRFLDWKTMMSNRSFSRTEEKGLFGELYVLRKIIERTDPLTAVRAWMGPDFAVQDFKFASSWVEVKTINSSSFSVKINSIEQLDCTDPGYLFVVQADEDTYGEKTETVFSLFEELSSVIKKFSGEAYQLFMDKLTEFRYIIYTDNDDQMKFSVKGEVIYRVDDSFPHLNSFDDRHAIKSVKYELMLSALNEWMVK